MLGRSDQCCRGSSACTEVSDMERSGCRLAAQPVCNHGQPLRQQLDVEAKMRGLKINEFLVRREQADEEGCESAFCQYVRHILITWTMPATPAPVGKDGDSLGSFWNMQIALNLIAADRYINQTRFWIHNYTPFRDSNNNQA